jgi:hypothetical protein
MKQLVAIAIIMWMAALGAGSQAFAEEYYVIKSRSGIVRIVDHKPQGRATIVKGPFKTREEAETAWKSSVKPKSSPVN